MRPKLFLTTLKLFGVSPKKYADIAVLIELVHNGTLVLDDIEDDGVLRRGKPTVHQKYGIDTATNVGMSLHVMPLRMLLVNHKELSDEQRLRMWEIYAEEVTNVSFGQALDIYWHKNQTNEIRKSRYLEMVRLKTGSLMRMSMRMACVVAAKDRKTEEIFSEFAEDLGISFQVIDDVLDLTPGNEKFGKAYGNDISEGKVSLPVIYALQKASLEDHNLLLDILHKHTKDRRLIEKAISIIEQTGARSRAVAFAKKTILKAWRKLERKYIEEKDLSELKRLAFYFVERDY
ncbi:hypothetical protein A2801_02505 [Candidatus Woesebacteria bacterium RIFCSPHIGHO2_01_FULL_41_10]|uniref:Polyprenyl synthetase n=1 Tax=Candidatus Woesebacteria bacterium RIFCSPHIGHO2_01_FULL_41_10 TaxID=1802500 RepID=A0A1F7YP66_9BACT|nr:MAG: hypothetical protein A2801_02505 [Candidatus Woesebacteria bacterium RIFCSPHIGHO2_01_FULL_41_10]